MFKVPDWGEDTPKSKITFAKKLHNKKNVKLVQENYNSNENINLSATKNKVKAFKAKSNVQKTKTVKKNVQSTNNIKTERNQIETKVKLTNGLQTMKNTKQHKNKTRNKKEKKGLVNPDLEIDNWDLDKTDEILVNVKKKKLNDKYKSEDQEEILFSEKETVENNGMPTSTKTAKKRKHGSNNTMKEEELGNAKEANNNIDDIDKIPAKKKKPNVSPSNSDNEDITPFSDKKNTHNNVQNKYMQKIKKEKLKQIIQSNRKSIKVSGNKLRERMLERLKAAQFRYLNEKLYTSSGTEAQELFQTDPSAFQTYHQGYQQQLKKWPVNPLDVIVKRISKMPKTHVIADMGCGEAALSRRVPHTVHSFDLVAATPDVRVCDMAHTPLLASSVDVAVYCLALMGTQLTQYLAEANRILKTRGHLLIAEVESRFDDADAFARSVEQLGFKLKSLDKSNQVFFFLQFVKTRDLPAKKGKLPKLTLKPCLYKKR